MKNNIIKHILTLLTYIYRVGNLKPPTAAVHRQKKIE